jgi:hypothetical protein
MSCQLPRAACRCAGRMMPECQSRPPVTILWWRRCSRGQPTRWPPRKRRHRRQVSHPTVETRDIAGGDRTDRSDGDQSPGGLRARARPRRAAGGGGAQGDSRHDGGQGSDGMARRRVGGPAVETLVAPDRRLRSSANVRFSRRRLELLAMAQ